jgi:protein-disulfide isomerase-like protein with CxxC motif
VQVRWFTDAACSRSWGAEPQLRRLLWELEGELEFVWVMGGLVRRLSVLVFPPHSGRKGRGTLS